MLAGCMRMLASSASLNSSSNRSEQQRRPLALCWGCFLVKGYVVPSIAHLLGELAELGGCHVVRLHANPIQGICSCFHALNQYG